MVKVAGIWLRAQSKLKARLSIFFRSAVYSCVASAGQAEDYQAMLRLHEQADSHEEKERIARWTIFISFFHFDSTGLVSLPSPTRRCCHRPWTSALGHACAARTLSIWLGVLPKTVLGETFPGSSSRRTSSCWREGEAQLKGDQKILKRGLKGDLILGKKGTQIT